ncbi:hypothetical protein LTR78_007241 [Recurvomyces mirabilis]|uniref:Uncharacterized protein n=1 Tax=Recurvomyces mirabilis TaxID=574656 RepID=A0AAE1BYQ5_9PEZI|nr:hypothetical protein LTR78_007241 [Recurvomyces mirabilis]
MSATTTNREDSPMFEPDTTTTHAPLTPPSSQPPLPPKETLALPTVVKGGKTIPYNALQLEGRPNLAYYSDCFPKIEVELRSLCEDFLAMYAKLQAGGYHHPEVNNIVTKQLEASRDSARLYPPTCRVANLGSSGIGKSSTFNSLIGTDGVAREDGSSHRGTFRPQENEQCPESQATNNQQLEEIVREHVKHIVVYLALEEEGQDGGGTDFEKRFATAFTFFTFVLAHKHEFHGLDTTEAYFQDRYDPSEESMTNLGTELYSDVVNAKKTMGYYHKIMDFPAQDDAILLKLYQRLTKSMAEVTATFASRHPWPLVQKITVRKQADVLQAGIILADLPGIVDRAISVVRSAMDYLKHASFGLVFTKALRADADDVLDDNLRACIALDLINLVYLVVTKIGELSPFSAAEWPRLEPADLARLEGAEALRESLQTEMGTNEEQQQVARDAGDLPR